MAGHRHTLRLAATAFASVVALTACGEAPPAGGGDAPAIEPISAHASVKLDWEKSWDTAFTRARSEDKPVLVTFEAEWCVWCKKLESTTYRDSEVVSLIASSLVPLALDVDGSGKDLSDEHGVDSLPTVLVLSPGGEERGRINGYLPPGQFLEAVTEILHKS
jgi:thiol:disulfide interchange protein